MAILVKFQMSSCGTCGMMAKFDSKVASEEGVDFEVCKVTDVDDYVRYRDVLLLAHPDLENVGYPLYVLVDAVEPEDEDAAASEPTMIGSIRGGMDKGRFRTKLKTLTQFLD